VKGGLPVHPGELLERVRVLLARGEPFATQSDLVLTILGWLVCTEELPLPVMVVYVDASGRTYDNPLDANGQLVKPWPEEGRNSIQVAAFHYRYDSILSSRPG
jgi:hypothetical protein